MLFISESTTYLAVAGFIVGEYSEYILSKYACLKAHLHILVFQEVSSRTWQSDCFFELLEWVRQQGSHEHVWYFPAIWSSCVV
jgi:hypothetical protein